MQAPKIKILSTWEIKDVNSLFFLADWTVRAFVTWCVVTNYVIKKWKHEDTAVNAVLKRSVVKNNEINKLSKSQLKRALREQNQIWEVMFGEAFDACLERDWLASEVSDLEYTNQELQETLNRRNGVIDEYKKFLSFAITC
jgi:hypothetical protein